jgi:high-affinity iron transporter
MCFVGHCVLWLPSFLALASDESGPPTERARQLLLLVQYVGTDYAAAVKDGAVAVQAEYDEAVQNTADALDIYAGLRPGGPQAATLRKLQALVQAKAPPDQVLGTAMQVVPQLSDELGVVPFPTHTPDLLRGAQMYNQHCASCHGAQGRGDGPAGRTLEPAPADFSQAERVDQLAPFQVFNTVTLGIAGTGMAAFASVLDEKSRWDVAFHILTFRIPASAPQPHDALPIPELAAHSNAKLADRLAAQHAAPSRAHALSLVDAARRAMPVPLSAAEAMARLLGATAKARRLVEQGDRSAAGEVITTAYFDAVEPVEAQLRSTAPEQVLALEGAVAALRRAIKDGAEINAAVLDVEHRARSLVPSPTAGDPPWGFLAGTGLLVLATLAAIFALARRRT